MDKLTYEQLGTVVSRFQTSCLKLRNSGDYPEEKKDLEILDTLLNMKWYAGKEEGVL